MWAAIIFFFSSRPGSDMAPSGLFGAIIGALNNFQVLVFGSDLGLTTPVLHFCEFAILSLFLTFAARSLFTPGRSAIISVIVSSLYGALDEFHQWFVPGRACDPLDWVVDTLSALLAALICYIVLKTQKYPHNDRNTTDQSIA